MDVGTPAPHRCAVGSKLKENFGNLHEKLSAWMRTSKCGREKVHSQRCAHHARRCKPAPSPGSPSCGTSGTPPYLDKLRGFQEFGNVSHLK